MKTCSECFSKCKAECCRFVPMSIRFLENHQDLFQRKVLKLEPHNGNPRFVYPITTIECWEKGVPVVFKEKQICPFLDSNNRCVVYNERPEICKLYGTTHQEDNSLTCQYHLGRDFSFPKDNTPLKALIDKANQEGKYLDETMNNQKFILEMLGF